MPQEYHDKQLPPQACDGQCSLPPVRLTARRHAPFLSLPVLTSSGALTARRHAPFLSLPSAASLVGRKNQTVGNVLSPVPAGVRVTGVFELEINTGHGGLSDRVLELQACIW